jgi:hypothetical protein
MNTTVIVFKHSVKGLGFPKYERLDEKASPKSIAEKGILSCILLKNHE